MAEETRTPDAPDSPQVLPAEPWVGTYTFANFQVDLATHQLLRDGQPVPLGVKAFDTLVALLRHQSRVVTKEELIKWVWPDSFVSEDSLTHTISAIRRALGDDPAAPRFISTIARRGYRFVALVTQVAREEPARPPTAAAKEAPLPEPSQTAPVAAVPAKGGYRRPLTWAALGAAAALFLVFVAQRTFTAPSDAAATRSLRFTQELPLGTTLFSGGVLSPDGRYLAFVARDDGSGRTQMWVRLLDSAEARPLPGTDGANRPFWSPDSQAIGFFSGSRVMRIGLNGEAPQSLTPTVNARPTGTWGSSGIILYADFGRLYSVPAAGGTVTQVLAPDQSAQETALRNPEFLPDGRHFLYSVASSDPDRAGTYVGSLDSTEKTRLLDGAHSSATYSPDGYLIYVRDGALLAQPFDASQGTLTGDPRAIAGNVSPGAIISAAAGGLLAFGGGTTAEGLVWFDRTGKALGSLGGMALLSNVMFSPDQRQLAGSAADSSQSGVWLVDLDRGAGTGFVNDGVGPLWSPDGSRIALTATRPPDGPGIYTRSTTGGNEDVPLLVSQQWKILQDWSPDGRHLVFSIGSIKTKNDLWLLPLSGEATPRPFLEGPANEIQARVSPDGRWMTYASDETGRWEVYVQSFPTPGSKRTISVGGGAQPQWRADARELFYLSLDNTVMAVDISANGTLQVGRPRPLFKAPVLGSLTDYRNLYAVTADGGRFLIKSIAAGGYQEPITVLVNWAALARD